MEPDQEVDQDSGGDSFPVWTARILGVLLAAAFLVFGVYLFEGGGLDALLPRWGWLLDAVLGGAFVGVATGLGVTSITGENRWLSKLRDRQERREALPGGPEFPGLEGEEPLDQLASGPGSDSDHRSTSDPT